jgi:pimeloyl-ACP methyl ester carboxylesterase
VDKTITYHSSTIFYRTEGTGNPVVLIHGFAEDGTIWDNQIEFLKNYFLLITPDLPGSGKSFINNNEDKFLSTVSSQLATIEYYADCIKAILEEEKISNPVIIGHSLGGYITLAFAEKYPFSLKAFGLFHSTAYADSEEKKNTRRKSIEFIRKHGAAEFIKQSMPNLFSDVFKQQHPGIIEELIKRYDNFNAGSLVSYYEAMILRPDRTAVLQNFKGPVLFIMGEKDNAVPLEQSLKQCHLPGLSYIHIPENTAHMGMLEATKSVNTFLLSFIKNVAV